MPRRVHFKTSDDVRHFHRDSPVCTKVNSDCAIEEEEVEVLDKNSDNCISGIPLWVWTVCAPILLLVCILVLIVIVVSQQVSLQKIKTRQTDHVSGGGIHNLILRPIGHNKMADWADL